MVRVSYTRYISLTLLCLAGFSTSEAVNKSTYDILTSIYGPIDTWHAIRAIDLHPNGIFDGHPVNESIIFAYEPPTSATEEQHKLASSLLSQQAIIQRRASSECYNTGNWVSQLQLLSGKDTYCQDAQGHLNSDGSHQQYKQWWQASDGTWSRFVATNTGKFSNVWFRMKWGSPGSFSLTACKEYYSFLITDCRGKRPDTAGGVTTQGPITVGLDPDDN
jgi:hypothetical protein